MEIDGWWPNLDAETREWLIAHNGEAVPAAVIGRIAAAAGDEASGARWIGESDAEGFHLSDEAVDWIEATANSEPG